MINMTEGDRGNRQKTIIIVTKHPVICQDIVLKREISITFISASVYGVVLDLRSIKRRNIYLLIMNANKHTIANF
jgi:hypothetical protein